MAAVLGFIAFCLIIGPSFLNPLNLSWMNDADYVSLQVGSMFFIHSSWQFPIGELTGFVTPFKTSVAFVAQVPWISLVLKVFAHWLPHNFQYVGLWIAVCMMLQGAFAAKLMRYFTQECTFILLGAVFFILMPAFIFRLTMHGDLAAQWTILCALCLYFETNQQKAKRGWLLLLPLLVGIHMYLYAMCFALFVADLIRNTNGLKSTLKAINLLLVILVLSLILMWLLGYFVIPSSDSIAGGYGRFSMNLLAPFNGFDFVPTVLMPSTYTYYYGAYEGFNYLGMGVLLMLLVALLRYNKKAVSEATARHFALYMICILLTLFAIGDSWSIGPLHIASTQLPSWILYVCDTFRSSGRFFWPVGYLLLLTGLVVVLRCYKRPLALAILVLCLVVQLIDCTALYTNFRFLAQKYPPYAYSPTWKKAFKGVKHVVQLQPIQNTRLLYAFVKILPNYDVTYNIPITKRMDLKRRAKELDKNRVRFSKMDLVPHTLYILTDKKHIPAELPKGVKVFDLDGIWGVRSDE